MATTFMDRLFYHFFFIISKISHNAICNNIDSDLYTFMVINQYLFDKFYEIMIDTRELKYFIIDYV